MNQSTTETTETAGTEAERGADGQAAEGLQGEVVEQAIEPTGEVGEGQAGDPNDEPGEQQQKTPDWLRNLRRENRELKRKQKELEQRLQKPADAPVLGAKPKLEDHDYDAEAFEVALSDWYEKKRAVDAKMEQRQAAEQAQQAEWKTRLETYAQEKTALAADDYEESEEAVTDTLSEVQQGIIIQGASNPAALVYKLGKDEARLQVLANIKDPVKFAFAIAKLETDMKTPAKTKPEPERRLSGGRPAAPATSGHLDKLRERAQQTGDYTAYFAAKNKKS